MRRLAIIAGTAGKAEFGHVEVPATLQQGTGEVETRPVGDFGAWHTAKKGTATMLYVVQGEWTVEVPGGSRSFGPGSWVVSQDFGVGDENGHRSRSSGQEPLILWKVTVNSVFAIME